MSVVNYNTHNYKSEAIQFGNIKVTVTFETSGIKWEAGKLSVSRGKER